MVKFIILVSIAFAGLFFCSCSNSTDEKWELVWSDEFDYTGLPDETKWNYDTVGNSYGWGNNELQFYTTRDEDNVWVDGSHLAINALKERTGDFNYTSGRITTKEKGDWLYGRVEIHAKVPGGRGIWPAIWMLPTDWEYGGWPDSGEIDIMEHVGYEPDSIYTTVHTGAFNHSIGTQVGESTYVPDCEDEFYTYAIEWYPEKIDFFIDGDKAFTFKNSGKNSDEWPFDKRFHLLLNVAVGGNWGGQHGVDDSIFPATMLVDYVRVYKK
jgi:beta-glucanase (GH16 family)